jgi:hypothetical protein
MIPLLLDPDPAIAPFMGFVLFGLVLVNLATRHLAHRSHVEGAEEDGEDGIQRHRIHELSNVVLVLVGLYYTTIDMYLGVLFSVFAIGLFVTDFFEFETRRVEARNDRPIGAPRAAIAASVILLLYAMYVAFFFLVRPYWNAIV